MNNLLSIFDEFTDDKKIVKIGQIQDFTSIYQELRDELRNDHIKMKIVVDENITTGLNKTDAEMFREMKENNEILKFLSEELDLEI